MDAPSTVGDYFDVVSDFFDKRFREDQIVRLGFKVQRPVEIVQRSAAAASSAPSSSSADSSKATTGDSESTAVASSLIKLAPVVAINRDGTAQGRLKVGSMLEIGEYCTLNQRCSIDTEGKVTVKGDLAELVDGLEIRGKAEVNTLAPASEDVLEVEIELQRSDVYISGTVARSGGGEQGVTFDLGTKVANATIGVGLSREIQPDETSVAMYIGAGFCGDSWSVAGKLERENTSWNSIDVAVAHVLKPADPPKGVKASAAVPDALDKEDLDDTTASPYATMLCARISLNIPAETTLMDVGFSHAVNISRLQTTCFATLCDWFGSSLHSAVKLSSNGRLCALLGGKYCDALNFAVVARWNLFEGPSAPARIGLQLSLEQNA